MFTCRNIILLLFFFYSSPVNALEIKGIASKNSILKITTEQVTLPENEKLGWISSSYLLEAYPNFFVGGSLYGSAIGKRGGFFSIGSEFTWKKHLLKHWSVDFALYVGGGGGASANALVGGGLVIRPHLDILYKLKDYEIGVSASHVRFPYGKISSSQFGLVFSSLNNFTYLDPKSKVAHDEAQSSNGLGFDKIRGTTALYRGQLLEDTNINHSVLMLGMRADHLISPTAYWGVEVVGAAEGILGGYGEYLATLGVEHPLLENALSIGARVGVGMAGGGAAATKGGLIAKSSVNITADISDKYNISVEGGYMFAPLGQMQAAYIGANITVDLAQQNKQTNNRETSNYNWQAGLFNYHSVTLSNNTSAEPLAGIEIRLNRFIGEHFYHGLQIMYAAEGKNYGGYGHTFANIGYQSSVLNDLSMSVELAVGGGGGGGISVGGGALYMGNMYLDYALNNALSVRLGIGRLRSLKGALDTIVSEAFVTYSYNLLE